MGISPEMVAALWSVAKAAEDLSNVMYDIHTGIPASVYPEFVDLEMALKEYRKTKQREDDGYYR